MEKRVRSGIHCIAAVRSHSQFLHIQQVDDVVVQGDSGQGRYLVCATRTRFINYGESFVCWPPATLAPLVLR
eukprot:5456432-Amphidinium_carterae.6